MRFFSWMKWPLWLTERDNQTPCIVRIMVCIVFLVLLFDSFWSVYKAVNFDFAAQAHAWCDFLGFAALAIAGKALTEPKQDTK